MSKPTTPAHRWAPITDLSEDWRDLADPTLPMLAEEWASGRESVGDTPEIRRFNAELLREVAIETGLIEGLYSIDRGTTETLIRMGLIREELAQGIIDRSPDEIMPILEDQHSATEGLFDFVKQKRDLDVSYVKELHAHLTRHQPSTTALTSDGRRVEVPLLRGDWKTQPNNPRRADGAVHEYCPPEQVASEMDRLIAMHREHEAAGVSPEVSAAWLHHRFTQIHPFQDGNGRVARSLASLVFLRAGWFLFGVTREQREDYIDALECADNGREEYLASFFSETQKTYFDRALTSLSKSEAATLDKASLAERIRERLSDRGSVFFLEMRAEMSFNSIKEILLDLIKDYYIDLNLETFRQFGNLKDEVFGAVIGDYVEFNTGRLSRIGMKYIHDGKLIAIEPFISNKLPKKWLYKSYKSERYIINGRLSTREEIAEFKKWVDGTLDWMTLEWERRR